MAAGDVEISTLVPQGEWTEDSLARLVEGYGRKLREMGALPEEIKSYVEHTSRGGVKIRVVWEKDSAGGPSGAVDAQHGDVSPAG